MDSMEVASKSSGAPSGKIMYTDPGVRPNIKPVKK